MQTLAILVDLVVETIAARVEEIHVVQLAIANVINGCNKREIKSVSLAGKTAAGFYSIACSGWYFANTWTKLKLKSTHRSQ